MERSPEEHDRMEALAELHATDLVPHLRNVERTIQRMKRDGASLEDMTQRAADMFDSASAKLLQRFPDNPLTKIECKAGCSYCCCEPVTVLPHEVALVARHLRTTLTELEIRDLCERMRHIIKDRTRGLRPKCALLSDDERCTVYAQRPLLCRSCTSPDVEQCTHMAVPGDNTPQVSFALPMILADYTNAATISGSDPNWRASAEPRRDELMNALLEILI